MQEYKSSLFVIGKNIVYAVGGAFVAALVLHWFINATLAVFIGLLAGLAIAYFAVYQDNIRVLVDDNTLSVWRFGKQLHTFALDEISCRANIITRTDSTGSDSDCTLTVTDRDGNETGIDCSMLGANRFYQLLDHLGLTESEPTPLKTTKE